MFGKREINIKVNKRIKQEALSPQPSPTVNKEDSSKTAVKEKESFMGGVKKFFKKNK